MNQNTTVELPAATTPTIPKGLVDETADYIEGILTCRLQAIDPRLCDLFYYYVALMMLRDQSHLLIGELPEAIDLAAQLEFERTVLAAPAVN